jgi:hypothetical protein
MHLSSSLPQSRPRKAEGRLRSCARQLQSTGRELNFFLRLPPQEISDIPDGK